MENNNQDQLPEEEIPNIEQFQVGRAPSENEDQLDDFEAEENNRDNDAGYTSGETEFADGEGTQLNEETDELDNNDEEAYEGEPGDEDANFENPDDDPA